jgi:hypothetical protein
MMSILYAGFYTFQWKYVLCNISRHFYWRLSGQIITVTLGLILKHGSRNHGTYAKRHVICEPRVLRAAWLMEVYKWRANIDNWLGADNDTHSERATTGRLCNFLYWMKRRVRLFVVTYAGSTPFCYWLARQRLACVLRGWGAPKKINHVLRVHTNTHGVFRSSKPPRWACTG